MDADSLETLKPKRIHVFENGNVNCFGRSLLIHSKRERTWNKVLTYVAQALKPSYGAVRHLITVDGKDSVHSFSELVDGARYVACGKEQFKKIKNGYHTELEYNQIKKHKCPKLYSKEVIKEGESSSKFWALQQAEKNKRTVIYVFVNGHTHQVPKKFVLTENDLHDWPKILGYVSNQLDQPESIRFLCTVFGKKVCGPCELQHGAYYVAVPYGEKFQSLDYINNYKEFVLTKERSGEAIKQFDIGAISSPLGIGIKNDECFFEGITGEYKQHHKLSDNFEKAAKRKKETRRAHSAPRKKSLEKRIPSKERKRELSSKRAKSIKRKDASGKERSNKACCSKKQVQEQLDGGKGSKQKKIPLKATRKEYKVKKPLDSSDEVTVEAVGIKIVTERDIKTNNQITQTVNDERKFTVIHSTESGLRIVGADEVARRKSSSLSSIASKKECKFITEHIKKRKEKLDQLAKSTDDEKSVKHRGSTVSFSYCYVNGDAMKEIDASDPDDDGLVNIKSVSIFERPVIILPENSDDDARTDLAVRKSVADRRSTGFNFQFNYQSLSDEDDEDDDAKNCSRNGSIACGDESVKDGENMSATEQGTDLEALQKDEQSEKLIYESEITRTSLDESTDENKSNKEDESVKNVYQMEGPVPICTLSTCANLKRGTCPKNPSVLKSELDSNELSDQLEQFKADELEIECRNRPCFLNTCANIARGTCIKGLKHQARALRTDQLENESEPFKKNKPEMKLTEPACVLSISPNINQGIGMDNSSISGKSLNSNHPRELQQDAEDKSEVQSVCTLNNCADIKEGKCVNNPAIGTQPVNSNESNKESAKALQLTCTLNSCPKIDKGTCMSNPSVNKPSDQTISKPLNDAADCISIGSSSMKSIKEEKISKTAFTKSEPLSEKRSSLVTEVKLLLQKKMKRCSEQKVHCSGIAKSKDKTLSKHSANVQTCNKLEAIKRAYETDLIRDSFCQCESLLLQDSGGDEEKEPSLDAVTGNDLDREREDTEQSSLQDAICPCESLLVKSDTGDKPKIMTFKDGITSSISDKEKREKGLIQDASTQHDSLQEENNEVNEPEKLSLRSETASIVSNRGKQELEASQDETMSEYSQASQERPFGLGKIQTPSGLAPQICSNNPKSADGAVCYCQCKENSKEPETEIFYTSSTDDQQSPPQLKYYVLRNTSYSEFVPLDEENEQLEPTKEEPKRRSQSKAPFFNCFNMCK